MEKVLVTGNCGFIGHHLVKELKKCGYHVTGIDNLTNGLREHAALVDKFIFDDVEYINADMLKGYKHVFHLAALPRVPYSIEHPLETHDANVNHTLSLLIAARDAGVESFVFSSSSSVYGAIDTFPTPETALNRPLSPYAVQKLAAEQYCESFRHVYGLKTVSLRYFNVYGEEQPADNPYTGVITRFLQMAKEGKTLTIHGDGEQRRDFTYVGDVVAANILTAIKGEGIYNVGNGVNYSVNEVAGAISDNVEHADARKGDPRVSLADSTRLRDLGWKPKGDMMKWLKSKSATTTS